MLHMEFAAAAAAAEHGRNKPEVQLRAVGGGILAQQVKIFLNTFGDNAAKPAKGKINYGNAAGAVVRKLL